MAISIFNKLTRKLSAMFQRVQLMTKPVTCLIFQITTVFITSRYLTLFEIFSDNESLQYMKNDSFLFILMQSYDGFIKTHK